MTHPINYRRQQPVTAVTVEMEVKRGADIEDPWAFLEKELQTFQQVLKELESGKKLTILNWYVDGKYKLIN